MKNDNITLLDLDQAMIRTIDEKSDAQRVVIVGQDLQFDNVKFANAVKEGLAELKIDAPAQNEVQQIKVPEIIREKEIVYVPQIIEKIKEVPFVVKEIEQVPVPVVTKEYQKIEVPTIIEKVVVKEIQVPVIVEKLVVKEVQVPVIVKEPDVKVIEIEKIKYVDKIEYRNVEVPIVIKELEKVEINQQFPQWFKVCLVLQIISLGIIAIKTLIN